jgi:hypothetical protein
MRFLMTTICTLDDFPTVVFPVTRTAVTNKHVCTALGTTVKVNAGKGFSQDGLMIEIAHV